MCCPPSCASRLRNQFASQYCSRHRLFCGSGANNGTSPQQSNNLAGLPQDLSRVPAVPEHNVCLDCASKSDRQIWASNPATERKSMQNGSLIRAERQRGPAVWEFRWRELAGNGKRTHRRIVLGSVDRLVDEAAARQAVSALCIDINAGDARIKANITTVSELAEHYRQRELRPDRV